MPGDCQNQDSPDWVGNLSWKIVIPAKAGIQKLDTFVNVN